MVWLATKNKKSSFIYSLFSSHINKKASVDAVQTSVQMLDSKFKNSARLDDDDGGVTSETRLDSWLMTFQAEDLFEQSAQILRRDNWTD